MKVTSAKIIRYTKSYDEILIETDVPHPNGLGYLHFNTIANFGKRESYIRNNFGDVKIEIIDRSEERG
jgi:hypothetical protein